MNTSLQSIKIVLLNTFHPGNIGAAARAMKTMGLHELVLVEPCDFPSDEATSRAAGAAELLTNARVVTSFAEAINDCTQVFATTARQKQSYAGPQKSCSQAAEWIKENHQEKIAIVFGRERSGLTADEVSQCQQVLYIPGNPEYDVLNMASAVQIVCYELFKTLNVKSASDQSSESQDSKKETFSASKKSRLATQNERHHFEKILQVSLQNTGYLNPALPSDTMKRLQHLLTRANSTSRDINMMHGIIKSLVNFNSNNINNDK